VAFSGTTGQWKAEAAFCFTIAATAGIRDCKSASFLYEKQAGRVKPYGRPTGVLALYGKDLSLKVIRDGKSADLTKK